MPNAFKAQSKGKDFSKTMRLMPDLTMANTMNMRRSLPDN